MCQFEKTKTIRYYLIVDRKVFLLRDNLVRSL